MKILLIMSLIILATIIFWLFICFAVFIGNAIATMVIPPQLCPDDDTKMHIIVSNIYTGQVLYECPKCGRRVSYHYDDTELVRESDDYRRPLPRNGAKAKGDKDNE